MVGALREDLVCCDLRTRRRHIGRTKNYMKTFENEE
jgi:hypothetical protein